MKPTGPNMSPERVMLWLLAGVTVAAFATWLIQDSVLDAAVTFSILSCIVAAIWGASRYEKAIQLSGIKGGGILNMLAFVAVTAGLTYWCIYFYDFPLVGSIIGSIGTNAYIWWTFGMLEPGTTSS
jgi:multisubunit Na+/H+ antiporter MnhF subunit